MKKFWTTVFHHKNYGIIPLITVMVGVAGSYFTTQGMPWYDTLIFPDLLPPKYFFPLAWTVIYILSTVSALMLWNNKNQTKRKILFSWFIANAILNTAWCFLFFGLHLGLISFIEILFLQLTNLAIIILSWKISKIASVLILPYFIWGCFASYLTYAMMVLNNL